MKQLFSSTLVVVMVIVCCYGSVSALEAPDTRASLTLSSYNVGLTAGDSAGMISISYDVQSNKLASSIGVETVDICRFTGGSPVFLTVWGGQTEREAAFLDVKIHAARFLVCVGLTAFVGVLLGISGKPPFEGGVVGADMDKGVFLVKPYISGLFLFGKSCSHASSFCAPVTG